MSFKDKRVAVKLSQQQVAETLGIDQSAVSLWEQGKTAPRAALLPKLAKLYGCTIDELLREEDE